MTESSTSRDRRAQIAALIGALFQFVFFLALLVVGFAWSSDSILAAARFMAGGILVWPVIAIVYGQRRRVAIERLEVDELRRTQQEGAATAIFDSEDEAYLIEKRRLNWILRWLVPGAALVLAFYHLAGNFVGWGWSLGRPLGSDAWRIADDTGPAMAFVGGVGFLAFLFSRYTAGMARISGWQMMRAGASYLAGNAVACLIVLAALALQGGDLPNCEPIAAYAIRILMIVLGIEFLTNFVLDFYRPRAAGQETRPAFDSRTLALISEPGGIARSIADAINYQFGFEVTSTWFYLLLKRALAPMIAFGLLTLLLLSSLVIVDADERAVVERFGRRLQAPGEALAPGLHFKAPWPIDKVYQARVDQVRSLRVGTKADPAEEESEVVDGRLRPKPLLWGVEHQFNAEMLLIVASPELTRFDMDKGPDPTTRRSGGGSAKAVAVGLLMVSVEIQYCVSDIHDYLYEYADPERLVEAIAYQELSDYAAGVDMNHFMGPGRFELCNTLRGQLQSRLDELSTGIQVLYVGLQEAHPTTEVAKSFQEVVKAEREKDNLIENARGQAETMLTEIAGREDLALILDNAILEMNRVAQDPAATPDAIEAAEQRVEQLLFGSALPTGDTAVGGMAAMSIANEHAQMLSRVTEAQRDLTLFNADVVAYEAAPKVYRMRNYLDMLKRSVMNIRKYVLAVNPDKRILIIYDKAEEGSIDIGEPPK